MTKGLEFVLILFVIFGSTLIRTTFGFGNALLAMPLLVLVIGVLEATPLIALIGLTISVFMLLRDWESLRWKEIGYLLLASLLGIPLGLLLLTSVPENTVRGILGGVLIAFGFFNLLEINLPRVESDWLALPFGLLAGLLGAAYNSDGPPVIVFGIFRRWDKVQFRMTLQGYFLISNVLIIASHGLAGLWTPRVLILFLLSIPLVITAVFLGEAFASRLDDDTFSRMINYILILMGSLMFLF